MPKLMLTTKVLPEFEVFRIKTVKNGRRGESHKLLSLGLEARVAGEGSEEPVHDVTLAMFGN